MMPPAFITLAYARDIRPIDLEKETTVAIIVEGFTEDALETVKSIKANSDCGVVILSVGDPDTLVTEMDSRTYLFAVAQGAGWGDCANALLGKIKSKYLVLIDPSISFTGGRLLQMDLPLEQGRHHGYHDADPDYREVQSKKNYDRLLERFKGKSAILSPRR